MTGLLLMPMLASPSNGHGTGSTLAAATLAWSGDTIELVAALLVLGAMLALIIAAASVARRPGGIRSLYLGAGRDDAPAPDAAAELRALIGEARDMADQLAAGFDARVADLDRRLTALESRLRAAEDDAALHHAPGPLHAEPKLGPSLYAGPARPAVHSAGMTGGDADPMTGEIYRLSDQGLPAVEIARQLGQHTGKVELILALRRA